MDFVTPVLTVGLAGISLVVGWRVLKRRIFNEIALFANEFIRSIMQDAVEHPEKLAPLLDALTKQGMKSLGVTKEGSLPGMRIGGLKIPGWVIQMAQPLLEGQMKKMAGTTAEKAAESVFG